MQDGTPFALLEAGKGGIRLTSFFPSSIQSIFLLIVIVVLFVLTIVLPWKKKASATSMISLSLIIVFFLQLLLASDVIYSIPFISDMDRVSSYDIYKDLGFLPSAVIHEKALYQFITSTYLHGGFLHLIFNFIGLFLLGVQLEKRIGWSRFLVLYFGSGVMAGALVLFISPFDVAGHSMDVPSIGASGCIFGLIGGFWFLYPKDRIFFPLPLIFFRLYNAWPVWLIFLIYGGIASFFLLIGADDGTSHVAHFGGLVGAFPIAWLIRPPAEAPKVKKMKVPELGRYARTKKQREYLKKASDADEDDVRDAWLEEFFASIRCPKCRESTMVYRDGKAICPKCGHVIKP
ncbi:hypothetical protein B6U90_04970 [Thermoplasmatales archaeon ex4484_6]|nr:MAG: hypothetical protein B6U90_04970 [Thermoplasmatales archaeon ex4484_6]